LRGSVFPDLSHLFNSVVSSGLAQSRLPLDWGNFSIYRLFLQGTTGLFISSFDDYAHLEVGDASGALKLQPGDRVRVGL
jgi:hypothetical protein